MKPATPESRLRRLQNLPLPPPIVPQLGSAAVADWRQDYRRNRIGCARGATGELRDLLTRFKSLAHLKKVLRSKSVTPGDDEQLDGPTPATAAEAEDAWEALENAQALITEYRLAYRRHRMGDSVGAKGELSDLIRAMDASSLRLLPAAQIASLRTSQLPQGGLSRPSSTGLLGELQDTRLHVHFGAGRLGLGLVLPAVAASGVPFAVVQRPSDAFGPLSEHSGATSLDVLLTVNGAPYPGSSMAFVSAVADLPPLWLDWLKARRKNRVDSSNAAAEAAAATFAAAVASASAAGGAGGSGGSGGGSGGASSSASTETAAAASAEASKKVQAWKELAEASLPPPPGLTPKGLFVCGSDPELSELVTASASSFSTSLGPGIPALTNALPEELFRPCPPTSTRPALFAGENDHNAVDALAETLKGRVDVVSCMVDRICTGRDITGSPQREVAVRAEPYQGSVVVLTPPRHVPSPPFEGEHVLVPRSRAEADYLCRRKLLLVNGSHTTLAFLTLTVAAAAAAATATATETAATPTSGAASGGGGEGTTTATRTKAAASPPRPPFITLKDDKLTGAPAELELITLKTATAEQALLIRAWAVARLLVLLFEWDLEVLKSAHGCTSEEQVADVLLGFANETLDRFSTTSDTAGRILGGGVAARFKGRLEPVLSFLKDTMPAASASSSSSASSGAAAAAASSSSPVKAKKRRSVASLVLDKSGLDMATIRKCVEELTEQAHGFIGQAAPTTSN